VTFTAVRKCKQLYGPCNTSHFTLHTNTNTASVAISCCASGSSSREFKDVIDCNIYVNPLQPSGHNMYRQFNIQQLYVLPTHCIYVFCVDLRTNSEYLTLYSPVVTICTAGLTFNNSTFCPHSVFMCTAQISATGET